MTVPIWYVACLSLLLTGVSTEIDISRTTVRPSPSAVVDQKVKTSTSISFASDVFSFACTSVCGNTGKVLRCELKTNGECAKRYYVVCNGKDQCQWETMKASCEEARTNQDECERLLGDGGKARRRSETYLRSVGIVPALRRRLSSVRRRDLGEQQPYSGRSGMVMTSGNAHAYAMDNNHLVQSHFGRPPVYSSRPENDILGFPFSFISRLPNFNTPTYSNTNSNPPQTATVPIPSPAVDQTDSNVRDQTAQPNPPAPQPVNNWSGYQPIPYQPLGAYTTVGHYPTMYQPQNGYNQGYSYSANDDYGMWGNRPRPYSPFTSFFNAVGLQDPMLLLQYLPVG